MYHLKAMPDYVYEMSDYSRRAWIERHLKAMRPVDFPCKTVQTALDNSPRGGRELQCGRRTNPSRELS